MVLDIYPKLTHQRRLAKDPSNALTRPLLCLTHPLSRVARAVIRRMLDNHLASEGLQKQGEGAATQSTGSIFVAQYSQDKDDDKNEIVDRKDRDLEASTEHIVPLSTLDVSLSTP